MLDRIDVEDVPQVLLATFGTATIGKCYPEHLLLAVREYRLHQGGLAVLTSDIVAHFNLTHRLPAAGYLDGRAQRLHLAFTCLQGHHLRRRIARIRRG